MSTVNEMISVDFVQIYSNFRMNIEIFVIRLIHLSSALKCLPLPLRTILGNWFASNFVYCQHCVGGKGEIV